jgi:hypothetical protein
MSWTKSVNHGALLMLRLKQLIRLRGHDEVVLVEAFDHMSPPIDGYTAIEILRLSYYKK